MRDIARGGRLRSRRTTHVEAGCWRAALVRGMRARGAASAARCPACGTWRGASQRAACCQPTALGAVRCNVQRASLCAPSKKEVPVDEIAETCSALLHALFALPYVVGGAFASRLGDERVAMRQQFACSPAQKPLKGFAGSQKDDTMPGVRQLKAQYERIRLSSPSNSLVRYYCGTRESGASGQPKEAKRYCRYSFR